MRQNFDRYCRFMLTHLEGGGVEHSVPGDPGGTTKWGFAQKFNPDINVLDLTEDTAVARALKNYWIPARCDELSFPSDIVIFDCAFNQSLSFAKEIAIESQNWQDACLKRMQRYHEKSNQKFMLGLYERIVFMYSYIESGGAS